MKKDIQKSTEIILYTTPDGKVRIEVLFEAETIWLTQKKLAELFGVDRSVVTKHLQNIYGEGELDKELTSAKIAQVKSEGQRQVTRNIEFYNLDVIISVGYRINTSKATQFRIWATQTLKEFIIKGFVLDDERLKNGTHFVKIISKSYLNEFGKFVQAKGVFIKKLLIFTQLPLITIQTLKQPMSFLQLYKIS